MSSVSSYSTTPKTIATYKVLLTIIAKLSSSPESSDSLITFISARPEVTAVPFLLWLADQEAAAEEGSQKQQMADICDMLVRCRESMDDDRMDELYTSTLKQISASKDAGTALAIANDPSQYALSLAEHVTGSPVVLQGYDPLYDAIIKVAPPVALSVEGVRQGHAQAKELEADLRLRRAKSVSHMIGRVQLNPEEADRLLAGTAASRILDMLLLMPSHQERESILPDCFTPPTPPPPPPTSPKAAAAASAAAGSSSRSTSSSSPGGSESSSGSSPSEDAAKAAKSVQDDSPAGDAQEPETDELWCTPAQLLNELDTRLKAEARLEAAPDSALQMSSGGARKMLQGASGPGQSSSSRQQGQLSGSAGPPQGLSGQALREALARLRVAVNVIWNDSL
ncbi:MAG: hypothetical protein WDW38_004080 [Sanguina aurantia]